MNPWTEPRWRNGFDCEAGRRNDAHCSLVRRPNDVRRARFDGTATGGDSFTRSKTPGVRSLSLLAVLTVVVAPAVARAFPLLYLPDSVAGARSIAMGDAFRGVASSNDAIIDNPAGLALNPHYEIAGFFAWDTAAPAAYWNGSVVDATTLPLAVGVSYSHIGSGNDILGNMAPGRYVGSSYRLALAYPVSDVLAVGVNADWLRYGGDVNGGNGIDAVTGGAALALKLGDMFTIGAVGSNLVDVGTSLVPRQFAVGASFGTDSTFRVDVDGVATIEQSAAYDLHVGGEYFLAQLLALRGGYFYSGLTQQHFVSGGVGLVVPGFAIEGAYRQSVAPWVDHLFVVDLKFFLDG